MRNLPLLIDAICEAYDLPAHKPRDTSGDGKNETFCNFAVRYVAERMGYQGFKGLMANDMVSLLENSDQWAKISPPDAQNMANQGHLVVAGARATPHGHVCVVRPGQPVQSSKYGTLVPKVMNVGAENFIGLTSQGKPAASNWAFPVMPGFWHWRGK